MVTYFALRDEDAPQCVEADRRAVPRLAQPALQVEHGDAGAEKLREVMQQEESVPEAHDGDLLQVVVLHGDLQKHKERGEKAEISKRQTRNAELLLPSGGQPELVQHL